MIIEALLRNANIDPHSHHIMNAPAGKKASKKRASVEDSMESNTEEEEVHVGNDKD